MTEALELQAIMVHNLNIQLNDTIIMQIKAYLKPHCGWSKGVRAIMKKYELKFEDIDIVNNPENYAEMVDKSGQNLSPCVEIEGVMLADVSGQEVETYMLSNNLVQANDIEPEVPTDFCCQHEKAPEIKEKTVRFF